MSESNTACAYEPVEAPPRKKRLGEDDWLIICFLMPTVAFLILLLWYPFLKGVWMSFHNWPFIGEPKWVGWDNYKDFLSATYFREVIWR